MWHQILVGCFLLAACGAESSKSDTVDRLRPKRLTQYPSPQRQPQQSQQYASPQINYRPYNEAPESIKQLLQLQQYREPIVHIPVGPAPQLVPNAPPPQPYPSQYAPKLQYGQIPQQPPPYKPLPFKPIQPQQAAYKGIQAARPNPRVPVQPPQNNYTPQYKTQYGQQQGPNALYRPAITGPPPGAKYPSHPQPYLSQYPKNLPPHLQKIIDAQRSYQG